MRAMRLPGHLAFALLWSCLALARFAVMVPIILWKVKQLPLHFIREHQGGDTGASLP